MRPARLPRPLLPLLVLLSCTEQEPPTGPAEPGEPAFGHTAGHKVVNSPADPGDGTCTAAQCTLREAIDDPGSTEISFAPGLTGPITLASPTAGGGPLVIDRRLSITGPGARIVIRRRSIDPDFRILRIGSGGTVTLTNLIIRGGRSSGDAPEGRGGGIFNEGTLRLTNCVVGGNSATLSGGGIFNLGTLTLTNSRVSGNPAGNSGGGLNNDVHATLTLIRSSVSGNTAAGSGGGGIYNDHNGTVTLIHSTVSGNAAFRGVGGGLWNTFGTVTLRNSTISGNTAAEGGGGIETTFGTLTLRSSTVARNSATEWGGGIGGSGATLTLTNSLVALNRAPSGPDVSQARGDSEGEEGSVRARFNLIGIGVGSGIRDGVNGNQVGSQSAPLDPKVGPLAHNGGPTRTHALLAGSPGIDAASTPACPTTDQRGVLRPQGPACDIGSVER